LRSDPALLAHEAIERRATMAWAILAGAGLLEIVGAIALQYTDGFTHACGESASLLRLGFLALILIGIVGLKLVEG